MRLKNVSVITYMIIWGTYVILRILSVAPIVEPKIYPDSGTYLTIASQPFFSADFWGAGTPIITPLVYKLLGGNTQGIVLFQSIFSILAWTILAVAAARSVRTPRLKPLAFCTILLFSLSGEIMLWDGVVLSESISGSLSALFIAAWFWFLEEHNWDWGKAAIVMGVGGLWMLTRDTNALLVLGVAGVLLGLSIVKLADKRYLYIGIFFLAVFALGIGSASSGGRWISPNLNIMSRRILTNPEYIEFYQQNGMPVTPEVLALAGAKARPVDAGFSDDPALDEFHQWHAENGRSVYLKFLLLKPVDTLLSPIQNISTMVYTEPLFLYAPRGFRSLLPYPVDQIAFFQTWNPLTAWILGFSVVIGLTFAIWSKDRKWAVPLVMLLLVYPHLLTIWHIANPEALEFRHAYQFNVHLRTYVWIALILAIDDFSALVISRHISSIRKLHRGFVWGGLFIVIASLVVDFILPGHDTFSIGYAQGFGLVSGLLLICFGLRLRQNWQ